MQLIDINLTKSIICRLMHDPILLENIDYNISANDFADRLPKLIFMTLSNMRCITKIHDEEYDPIIVDSYIRTKQSNVEAYYDANNGLEFIKQCYNKRLTGTFEYDYNKLKKLSLLRELKKKNYDISYYYKESPDNLKEENELLFRFETATIEDILNKMEGSINELRERYICGGRHSGNVSDGVTSMIKQFATSPEIGLNINGDIFSSCCRGARLGKFYLRSGSSGTGKTRLTVFDSCKIAFPVKWNHIENNFCYEVERDEYGNEVIREPEKVLLITTEQDKEEMQTIILSYLSGVNETTIITGRWTEEEKARVDYAIYLMEKYKEYYYLDEISDPDLNNVSNTIKKYVTLYDVKYVFFDYIFSSPALISQFQAAHIREDVALGMLANQLKQLAKDYNIFVISSTQLNGEGVGKPGFKNETCLRGAKALADKADVGAIAQQISNEEFTGDFLTKFTTMKNSGELDTNENIRRLRAKGMLDKITPTHVIDIYKMRRGRYKNVRIWYYIDLGTGERYDLFMTNAMNGFMYNEKEFDVFLIKTLPITENWHQIGKDFVNDR